jgi:hypothetical protein
MFRVRFAVFCGLSLVAAVLLVGCPGGGGNDPKVNSSAPTVPVKGPGGAGGPGPAPL